jgi:hypothetical protein
VVALRRELLPAADALVAIPQRADAEQDEVGGTEDQDGIEQRRRRAEETRPGRRPRR